MDNIINGTDFQGMVKNALNNLINAEDVINSMNVFPVADGDTGTNMRLTLEHGFINAKANKHLGLYLKDLASGMLLGARGNSGVILSQLFKGMSIELLSKSIVNPREMKNALIKAYEVAYQAVVNPVEGTILTVAREGIDNIKHRIQGSITMEQTLKLYLKEMNASLQRTPELLTVLKDAAVLDSGAFGYIKIIEGMYKYLLEDIVEISKEYNPVVAPAQSPVSYFNENSEFSDGYCMEFLLQLLNCKHYKELFDLNSFIDTLKSFGNSLVVLQEENIVKVHIHTLNPSNVIDVARKYGEFVSFKLENMQLQHNEFSVFKTKKEEKKPLGIIAVTNGEKISDDYRLMGAHYVIECGGNMNASSSDFVNAINLVNAEKIVIFPNNPNTIGAAKQAIELAGCKDQATIIPSKSLMQGYYALQMDVPGEDVSSRIDAYLEAVDSVTTIGVSIASKDYEGKDFKCKTGDHIATVNDELYSACDNDVDALKEALNKISDIQDKVGMIIYLGKGVSEELEEQISDLLYDEFDHIEFSINHGEQDIYDILIGLF